MNVYVVMPAYNAEATLARTVAALPDRFRRNVIVGDDHSADRTADIASRLGVTLLRNERNLGYGGNLKRLLRAALAAGAEVVVELHADDQYDASLVDLLVAFIERGHFDVMQGSRIRSRSEALSGGMPWYRYYGNRALTFFQNIWFGLSLSEWHSGLKAFHADSLRRLPLGRYPNDHRFATEILMDCVSMGFRVADMPIPVRYRSDSSSVPILPLLRYGMATVIGALRRPPWSRRPFGSARAGDAAGH